MNVHEVAMGKKNVVMDKALLSPGGPKRAAARSAFRSVQQSARNDDRSVHSSSRISPSPFLAYKAASQVLVNNVPPCDNRGNAYFFNELALFLAGLAQHTNVLDKWRIIELKICLPVANSSGLSGCKGNSSPVL
jgi:hypothetical protein